MNASRLVYASTEVSALTRTDPSPVTAPGQDSLEISAPGTLTSAQPSPASMELPALITDHSLNASVLLDMRADCARLIRMNVPVSHARMAGSVKIERMGTPATV